LFDGFSAFKKNTEIDQGVDVHGVLPLLPRVNQAMLKRVFFCLKKVKGHAEKNKMNASNLGTVFGPNLLRSPVGMHTISPQLLTLLTPLAQTLTRISFETTNM